MPATTAGSIDSTGTGGSSIEAAGADRSSIEAGGADRSSIEAAGAGSGRAVGSALNVMLPAGRTSVCQNVTPTINIANESTAARPV